MKARATFAMFLQLVNCLLLMGAFVSGAPTIVVNESPFRLPIVRRLNLTGTTVLKADRDRAKFLKTFSQLPEHDFNITKTKESNSLKQNSAAIFGQGIADAGVFYTAEVGLCISIFFFFTLAITLSSGHSWQPTTTDVQPSCRHRKLQYMGRCSTGLVLGNLLHRAYWSTDGQ